MVWCGQDGWTSTREMDRVARIKSFWKKGKVGPTHTLQLPSKKKKKGKGLAGRNDQTSMAPGLPGRPALAASETALLQSPQRKERKKKKNARNVGPFPTRDQGLTSHKPPFVQQNGLTNRGGGGGEKATPRGIGQRISDSAVISTAVPGGES